MAQTPGTADAPDLSVLIPASNEEAYIGACLDALLAQDSGAGRIEVIVAANACKDRTIERSEARRGGFAARGWTLRTLDLDRGGKVNALNRAEELAAPGRPRVYLDADVVCDPQLLGQLRLALSDDRPRYATGTLAVKPAQSVVTRRYAAIWTRLPFVTGGAVGAGLFAVNAAGRARWGLFPDIISDDTFVRLQFAPDERVEVEARYHWPMIEGLRALIRVRRRQDAGVRQIAERWPGLIENEAKSPVTPRLLARLAASDPLGLGVYVLVGLVTRLGRNDTDWGRGR